MSKGRYIAAIVVSAALVAGCSQNDVFRRVPATFTESSRNAEWPGFLPTDEILSQNPEATQGSMAQIRGLQIRAQNLRQRARLLKRPVVEAQERLRLQNAVSRSQG